MNNTIYYISIVLCKIYIYAIANYLLYIIMYICFSLLSLQYIIIFYSFTEKLEIFHIVKIQFVCETDQICKHLCVCFAVKLMTHNQLVTNFDYNMNRYIYIRNNIKNLKNKNCWYKILWFIIFCEYKMTYWYCIQSL